MKAARACDFLRIVVFWPNRGGRQAVARGLASAMGGRGGNRTEAIYEGG